MPPGHPRDLVHQSWAEASWCLVNIGLPLMALALALGWVWPLRVAALALGAGPVLAAVNILRVAIKRPRPPAAKRPRPPAAERR